MKKRLEKIRIAMQSPQGKNSITFAVFLLISAVLWIVMTLNEETQLDLSCRVALTNVPDTLTRVSPLPEAINVSVRGQGTYLMKYMWKKRPTMNIDFRQYKSGNKIQFSSASLKAFFRNMIGAGSQVMSVTPDTLSILFTSQPGVKVPVELDAHITPAPHYVLVGNNKTFIDSVTLYSVEGISSHITSISTKPFSMTDVRKSQIVKVPLKTPRNMRAIPDSVDVSIEIEPLISKTRKVAITPINVPAGMKLITVPQQVEIYYMVPMNVYKRTDSDPKFKVIADYNTINDSTAEKIAVTLSYVPRDFLNVFLSADSVDFILEQK